MNLRRFLPTLALTLISLCPLPARADVIFVRDLDPAPSIEDWCPAFFRTAPVVELPVAVAEPKAERAPARDLLEGVALPRVHRPQAR